MTALDLRRIQLTRNVLLHEAIATMEEPAEDEEDDRGSDGDEHGRLTLGAEVADHEQVTVRLLLVDDGTCRRATGFGALRHQ